MFVRLIVISVFLVLASDSYPVEDLKVEKLHATPTEDEMQLEQNDILPMNVQPRNGLRSEWYRWPDAVVYYQFDSVFGDEHRALIREAFNNVERVTCVKFKPKADENMDYVYITGDNSGCNSHVGHIGGKQKMNLKLNGCMYLGTIIHESLHSLGFKHEHMSPNRDEYVRIENENIPTEYFFAFEKLTASYINDFDVPYDYNSVMHYGEKAFTKNGKSTIVPLTKGAKIGQRIGLSINDIRKINLMYKCPRNQYWN